MVYITAVHMSTGGTRHEHIESVKWRNSGQTATTVWTKATMVDWIDNKGGVAKVKDGTTDVSVVTVDGAPKYLRTKADGKLTDNLLSLPRY